MSLPRVPRVLAMAVPTCVLVLGLGCGEVPTASPPATDGGPARAGEGDLSSGPDGIRPATPAVPSPLPDPPADLDLVDMTASELIDRARMVFGLDERIRILEAAVAKEPEGRKALLMLMQAAEQKGGELALEPGGREASKPYLYRAAEVARALLLQDRPLTDSQRPFAAMVFYNEACNFALDGRPDRAIDALRRALELGFDDPVIHDDDELDPLRDRDDFRALAGRIPRPGAGDPCRIREE